ncbi:hypothetical protein [Streptomyces sp. NPDC057877]|uniref:hypothetical protein n=1 Tax=Streptomyces sp. NPDC057877 TaxID=3346269 RepID=UPI003681BA9A
MRAKLPARTRSAQTRAAVAVSAAALFSAAALIAALAPEASAAPSLPLPLPLVGAEPLVTEAVNVEGPLINNVSLPTLR